MFQLLESAGGDLAVFVVDMKNYGAIIDDIGAIPHVIDTVTGQIHILDISNPEKILSKQEITILQLIHNGLKSREIAAHLNISVHTVSRHRQNIIAKLKVRNSTEACRTARALNII